MVCTLDSIVVVTVNSSPIEILSGTLTLSTYTSFPLSFETLYTFKSIFSLFKSTTQFNKSPLFSSPSVINTILFEAFLSNKEKEVFIAF